MLCLWKFHTSSWLMLGAATSLNFQFTCIWKQERLKSTSLKYSLEQTMTFWWRISHNVSYLFAKLLKSLLLKTLIIFTTTCHSIFTKHCLVYKSKITWSIIFDDENLKMRQWRYSACVSNTRGRSNYYRFLYDIVRIFYIIDQIYKSKLGKMSKTPILFIKIHHNPPHVKKLYNW